MRSIWKGCLSIGKPNSLEKVNIPIALSTATREQTSGIFKYICPHDHSPIVYKRVCSKCGKEIPYNELMKGYFDGENTVALTQEQVKAIKSENNDTIEVLGFVRTGDLGTTHIRKSYWIMPQSKRIKKVRVFETKSVYLYELLRETLNLHGLSLIGKITMRDRERVVSVTPYGEYLILQQLFFYEEIVKPDGFQKPKLADKDTKLMGEVIKKRLKQVDIKEIKDDYAERLSELLEHPEKAVVVEKKRIQEPQQVTEMLEKALA